MEQYDEAPLSCQEQLDRDAWLQDLFRNLVRGGAPAVGYAVCSLLDHHGIAPSAFDYLSRWKDANLAGWFTFDEPRLPARLRPAPHLRLVPEPEPPPPESNPEPEPAT